MASNSTGFERDDHLTPRLISCVGPCPRHSGEEARPAAAPVPPGLMSLLAPCWIALLPYTPAVAARGIATRADDTVCRETAIRMGDGTIPASLAVLGSRSRAPRRSWPGSTWALATRRPGSSISPSGHLLGAYPVRCSWQVRGASTCSS